MSQPDLHLLWRDRSCLQRFRRGVSLHSHTSYSRESMSFIPRYTAGVPILARAIRKQEERYREKSGGRPMDYARAFWRPPLTPRDAFELEANQIRDVLGLEPLVSLSDHDNIEAGMMLSHLDVPVSVEWTIPFEHTFFHVGLHNLPAAKAPAIMEELTAVTANPTRDRARAMLAAVAQNPETLIVWNHPCWDEARVGKLEHTQYLGQFLERFGEFVQALELNGLRPWHENREVMQLSERTGLPLISGGDRHGLEANANVNLTNAENFGEFAEEIRDGHSIVLFLPQYREPLRVRMIETMLDIVRDYPDFPVERRRWSDRIYYEQQDGAIRPLSAIWKGGEGPWVVRWFLHGLRVTRSRRVRRALKLALADAQEIAL